MSTVGDQGGADTQPFRVWVDEQSYRCRSLIICTGASARMLGPHQQELYGRGASVWRHLRRLSYRDKEVAIVGGGDTAMEDALFLARFATKVTVIHRRDQLRAGPILAERALQHPQDRIPLGPRWLPPFTATSSRVLKG
ncbi:MAG: FAD-dependent oxidoreductase [Syntrophotaleaceae bacterium]